MFLPTLPQRSVTQVLSELREQWKDRPSWSRCLAPTRSKARGRQKKTFNNEGQRVKRCTRGRQAGWDRACHLLGISREAVSKNIAGGGNASHGQDYNTSVCTRFQQNCRKVGKCLAKAPHDTHHPPRAVIGRTGMGLLPRDSQEAIGTVGPGSYFRSHIFIDRTGGEHSGPTYLPSSDSHTRCRQHKWSWAHPSCESAPVRWVAESPISTDDLI